MTRIVYPATVEFDEGEPMTFRWATESARTAGIKHLRKKRGVTAVRVLPPQPDSSPHLQNTETKG